MWRTTLPASRPRELCDSWALLSFQNERSGARVEDDESLTRPSVLKGGSLRGEVQHDIISLLSFSPVAVGGERHPGWECRGSTHAQHRRTSSGVLSTSIHLRRQSRCGDQAEGRSSLRFRLFPLLNERARRAGLSALEIERASFRKRK